MTNRARDERASTGGLALRVRNLMARVQRPRSHLGPMIANSRRVERCAMRRAIVSIIGCPTQNLVEGCRQKARRSAHRRHRLTDPLVGKIGDRSPRPIRASWRPAQREIACHADERNRSVSGPRATNLGGRRILHDRAREAPRAPARGTQWESLIDGWTKRLWR
jgi:hypothetical protein